MYESVEHGNFVTAFYGVLDSKNDIFTFSNCGHNQPILLRSDGTVEYLKEGGLALGIVSDNDYEERPIFLRLGDLIVFYTDGVTEVNDNSGNEFGHKNLIKAIKDYQSFPAKEILKKIIAVIKDFASSQHVFDDLTMIILKKL